MDTWSPAGADNEHVERARALAPQIEACADQIERERRLAAPVLDALFEAGMFRLLLPRSLARRARSIPSPSSHVIEEIAKADASTAWCLCQASGCSMSAAYLPPDVASEVFGRDPRSVLAWGPGPDARAVAVDGRLSRHGHVELRQRLPPRHVAGRPLPRSREPDGSPPPGRGRQGGRAHDALPRRERRRSWMSGT